MKKLFTTAVLLASVANVHAQTTVAVSGEMSAHDNITTFISFDFLQSYGVNDPSLPISNLKVAGSMTFDDVTGDVTALTLSQVGTAELSWFSSETVTLAGLAWVYDPVTGALNQAGPAGDACVDTVDPSCSAFGFGGWQTVGDNADSWMDFDTIDPTYLLGGARVYSVEHPTEGNNCGFTGVGTGSVTATCYATYNVGGSAAGDYAARATFSLTVDSASTATLAGEMTAHDNITTFISFDFLQSYGVNDPSLPITNLDVIGVVTYDDSNNVTAMEIYQTGVAELSWFSSETVTLAGLTWVYDPVTGALNQADVAFDDCVDTVDPSCSAFGFGGWQTVGDNADSWMDFDTIDPTYLLGGARVYSVEHPTEGNNCGFTGVGTTSVTTTCYATYNVGGSAAGDYASRATFGLTATVLASDDVNVPVPAIAVILGGGILALVGVFARRRTVKVQ